MQVSSISSYNSSTGAIVLVLSSDHGLVSGQSFTISGATGGTNYSSINGTFTATSGTSGASLAFSIASGLGTVSKTQNFSVSSITSYNSTTGEIVLILSSAHGLSVGATFAISGAIGGTNYSSINGTWIATTSTTGSTVYFTIATGLGTVVAGTGAIIPIVTGASASVAINAGTGIGLNAKVLVYGAFSVSRTIASMVSSIAAYNSLTGIVQLVLDSDEIISAGNTFTISGASGGTNYGAINGTWTALSGTSDNLLYFSTSRTVSSITSYSTSTGAIILVLGSAHGMTVGSTFTIVNAIGGTNYTSINGSFTATSGTTGSTLCFTIATGLGTVVIGTGAAVSANSIVIGTGSVYVLPSWSSNLRYVKFSMKTSRIGSWSLYHAGTGVDPTSFTVTNTAYNTYSILAPADITQIVIACNAVGSFSDTLDLDWIYTGIDNFVPKLTPLTFLNKSTFEDQFWIEGSLDEVNPFWQYINVKDAWNSATSSWVQQVTVLKKVKKVTPTEQYYSYQDITGTEEAYVYITPALTYTAASGAVGRSIALNSNIATIDPFSNNYNGKILMNLIFNTKSFSNVIDPLIKDYANGNQYIYMSQDTEYASYAIKVNAGSSFSTSLLNYNPINWTNIDTPQLPESWNSLGKYTFSTNSITDESVSISEVALFNEYDEMMLYGTFPPVIYDPRKNHISFNIFIKKTPIILGVG